MLNHSQQNSVTTGGVFKATQFLYKTGWHLLTDVTLRRRGRCHQTTHCPWPVPHTSRICRRQSDRWQPCSGGRIYRGPPR